MKPEVILRHWRLFYGSSLSGNAYGHYRFTDGEYITTSTIIAIDKDSEDTFIVETMNTYYILEPAPDEQQREQFNSLLTKEPAHE